MKTTPATCTHSPDATPDTETTIAPFIAASPASEAVDWYAEVFDAEILSATEIDGQMINAELSFDQGLLQVGEPDLIYATGEAPAEIKACHSLGYYCHNVDDRVATALERGATLREAVATLDSGDQFGSIVDPFGVEWNVLTRVKNHDSSDSTTQITAWAEHIRPS